MADMDLKIKISTDINNAVKGLDKVSNEVKVLAKDVQQAKVFDSIKEQAEQVGTSLAGSFGPIGSLISNLITTPLGGAAVAIASLGKEAEFLFNRSLSGEKLNAINAQFENLSKSVNISADNLKNRLLKSLDGLVDGASSIQLANRALITLGEKAAILPKLMDAARKATAAFGGEPLENMNLLLRAIETGNTRMLKQIGLQINSSKELDNYAQSLGSVTANLSEEGRQQAIINAVLRETSKQYKDIDGTLTPLADANTRLKNSISDLREQFDKFITKNYAEFFTDVFNSVNTGFKKLTGNFTATDRVKELGEEISKIQNNINQLNLSRNSILGDKGIGSLASISLMNSELVKAKASLIPLNAEYKKLTSEIKETNAVLNEGGAIANENANSLIEKVVPKYTDTYKRLELLREQHALNLEKIEIDQQNRIADATKADNPTELLNKKYESEKEYYAKKQELERQDLELTLAKNLALANAELDKTNRAKLVEEANSGGKLETLRLKNQQEKELLQLASDQEVAIIKSKYDRMAPYVETFSSGLTNSFIEIASGTEELGKSLEKFARNFVSQLTQMILKAVIFDSIMKSLGFGAAGGGTKPGGSNSFNQSAQPGTFAKGGFVTGPGSGISDSIPAYLSNGEFVMKAAAVKSLGLSFLHGLNNVGRSGVKTKSKNGIRAFADGGLVTSAASAPQVVIQNSGSPKQASSTEFDPVSATTTIILEDISRNGAISKGFQNTFGMKRRTS